MVLTSFQFGNSLQSGASVVTASSSSDVVSNGTSSGGSSSPGHTLNKMTLLPHCFSGSYSAPPFTNGNIHISVGRGTVCKSLPSNLSNLPSTAGTIERCTSPSPLSEHSPSSCIAFNKSPPELRPGNTHVGPLTSLPTCKYNT